MCALVTGVQTCALPIWPGHVEHVAGYSQLAGALTGLFGPMSVQAISSQIYGLYGALTFLTPLFGGLIGARWLGTHRAVFVGGTIIALGHLMMAFEASFLFALLRSEEHTSELQSLMRI